MLVGHAGDQHLEPGHGREEGGEEQETEKERGEEGTGGDAGEDARRGDECERWSAAHLDT